MTSSDNRYFLNACFRRLHEDMGDLLGHQAVRIIAEELGGMTVHIPSLLTLEMEARDAAIREAYLGGYNYDQLADAYRLNRRTIRRIVHGGRG